MTQLAFTRITKILGTLAIMIYTIIANVMPAYAIDEIVTNEVTPTKTGTPWFYWPGWAFLGLIVLVALAIGFAWYKTIYIPKYRGQKVAQ